MNKFYFISIVFFLLCACNQEPKEVSLKAAIASISDTEITLADGVKVPLSKPESGNSTIFLLRPGEYDKEAINRMVADLTDEGYEYADKVKKLFDGKKIDHIISIGAAYANNTVKPMAEQRGLDIMHYTNIDYGALLDYIFNLEKGDVFLVLETHAKVGELLYTLSGDASYMPINAKDFKKLYLIEGKERTKVEVKRLKI